jgi:hypothetical protein
MKNARRMELTVLGVIALATLVVAGRLVGLSSWPADSGMAGWAAIPKLGFLALAALLAASVTRRFEAGNPARPTWLALTIGLSAAFFGQLCLAPYQLSGSEAPFPSLADPFFLISYPLFAAMLAVSIRAYGLSGIVRVRAAELWPLGFAVLALCAIGLWPLLRPILAAPDPALKKALNLSYPALDVLLLVPAILLLRITLPLRGGKVWRVWAALLLGFGLTLAGDLLFAYQTSLSFGRIDPLVHLAYIGSYGCFALAVIRQRLLIEE